MGLCDLVSLSVPRGAGPCWFLVCPHISWLRPSWSPGWRGLWACPSHPKLRPLPPALAGPCPALVSAQTAPAEPDCWPHTPLRKRGSGPLVPSWGTQPAAHSVGITPHPRTPLASDGLRWPCLQTHNVLVLQAGSPQRGHPQGHGEPAVGSSIPGFGS